MYRYEEGIFGLGTNGSKDAPIERPTFPSGATTQGEMDEFFRQQTALEASQQAQRTAQQTERSAVLTRSLNEPAAQIGLCAAGALPWGALLGALSSPKGERGGGAKWGILASLATCPLVPVWHRLGVFGTVINMALAWTAPILAARYRLKRKAERIAVQNGRPKEHYKKSATRWSGAGIAPQSKTDFPWHPIQELSLSREFYPVACRGGKVFGGMKGMRKSQAWRNAFIQAYIERWGHDPVEEGHRPRDFYKLMERGISPEDAAEEFGRYHEVE